MIYQIETEDLFREAKSGNRSAIDRFYSTLIVRFQPIVKCELERFPVLQKEMQNIEDISQGNLP